MNILSVGFAESVLAYSICCPVFFEYSICWWLSIHIYICTHASIHPSIHTYMHAYIHTCILHTTQLVHTQLTHTYSSTHNLLHTNPSPSLFSFLLSPCHLYLSLTACWKKLACGVIRSFNFFLVTCLVLTSEGPQKWLVESLWRDLPPTMNSLMGIPTLFLSYWFHHYTIHSKVSKHVVAFTLAA